MLTAVSVIRLLSALLVASQVVQGQLDKPDGHVIKVKLPQKIKEIKTDQLWTPEVSVHLLSLVEAMTTKLATWDVRFGQLETQMTSYQSHMETQLTSLQSHVETQLTSLQSHMDTVEGRIMAKINDGERQLTAVEQRLAADTSSVKDELSEIKAEVMAVKEKLSNSEDRMANGLSNLEGKVVTAVTNLEDKMLTAVTNLEDKMLTAVTNSEDKVKSEITLMKETIKGNPSANRPLDVSMLGVGQELHQFGNFVVDGVKDRLDTLSKKFDVDQEELIGHFRNVTDHLGDKISMAADGLGNVGLELAGNVSHNLVNLKQSIAGDARELILELSNVTEPLYGRVESVTNELRVVEDEIKSSVDKINVLPERLVDRLDKKLANVNEKLSQRLDDRFDILNKSLITSSESIKFGFDGLSTKIDHIGKTDFASCRKNMSKSFAFYAYPYPIVYDNIGNINEKEFLCDPITAGGGWIIIQYRSKGNTDFYRGWEDYKRGFGSLDKDFWIGLETIHTLTSAATYELRVELKFNDQTKYAHYGRFSVASEAESYKLSVGSYHGTAGDSLMHSDPNHYHNGMKFSTKDRDNDEYSDNCAVRYTGGWWYNNCLGANLNGQWGAKSWSGPCWQTFTGTDPATFTEMKIRRIN